MSVNINRSFINKLIVVVVFTCIFVSTSYTAPTAALETAVEVTASEPVVEKIVI